MKQGESQRTLTTWVALSRPSKLLLSTHFHPKNPTPSTAPCALNVVPAPHTSAAAASRSCAKKSIPPKVHSAANGSV